MDSNQEAKVSMYLKVQQFLTEKLAVLTALFSIITTYKTDLDDLIAGIFEADALATADTTGYTEAKQTLRDEMTTLALRIGGGGAAYYKLLGDSGSQEEIFFNPSEFTRAHDTAAYTMAMQVFRLANAAGVAGAALAPHGITTTDVSNLHLKAEQYLAILELPRRKVSAKGAQGKKVDALMSDTDDLLNETLDPQMRVLKGTADQELLDEYEGNRGIDDNPSGGGGGGLTSVVVEGDAPFGISDIEVPPFTPTDSTTVQLEISAAVQVSYGPAAGPPMGATVWFANPPQENKTWEAFAAATGYSIINTFLKFQNNNPGAVSYKITFNNVQE